MLHQILLADSPFKLPQNLSLQHEPFIISPFQWADYSLHLTIDHCTATFRSISQTVRSIAVATRPKCRALNNRDSNLFFCFIIAVLHRLGRGHAAKSLHRIDGCYTFLMRVIGICPGDGR
jgi:hypothetical protein